MEKKQQSDSSKHTVKDGFMAYSKANPSVFPSPAILESYEEIYPGFVNILVNMVEKEQKHRHKIEKLCKKINAFTIICGQILNLCLITVILIATLILTKAECYYMAIIVCTIGFVFMAIKILKKPKIDEKRYCLEKKEAKQPSTNEKQKNSIEELEISKDTDKLKNSTDRKNSFEHKKLSQSNNLGKKNPSHQHKILKNTNDTEIINSDIDIKQGNIKQHVVKKNTNPNYKSNHGSKKWR